MTMHDPASEDGMILLNVLLIVALAAAVLAIMLAGQDAALQRSTRLHEAAQAAAIARGGELSAIVALRRDAVVAPQVDTLREPWANIADRQAKIDGGRFDLVVADAQSRFNLNALARGDLASRETLVGIATIVGIDPTAAVRAAALLATGGPLSQLSDLRRAGLSAADIARLATLVTILPTATTVNMNTASEPLLAILLGNPATAHLLVARRERTGALSPEDFAAVQTLLPPGAGLTSNYFWCRARVTIGDTRQQLTSLLSRGSQQGQPSVVAVARWRGAAVPAEAPPLP